jgi:NitT/TauT family transport system substrate-binding protein
VESVNIGFQLDQTATENFVAQDKGFFTQNSLNVTIKSYETGIAAINAMLLDELDLAGVAEIALVRKAFEHQAISAIAVANKIESFSLVGRRDRGIENIADLGGKRIGVALQTIGEFYLRRFLELRGISPGMVTMVDMLPSHSVEALTNGSVDAVAFIQPYADMLEKQLGTNAISWGIQSSQVIFGMFVGKNAWIAEHPGLVKRFLKAIEQANDYIMEHPDEAKKILKNRFNYTDEYLELVWHENNFSLSLDQSLIVAMEDEARWMIKNKLTTEKQIPDFVNYIYVDGLKAVKPEAVKIIR